MNVEVGEFSLMFILFVKVVCYFVLRINFKVFSQWMFIIFREDILRILWFLKIEFSIRYLL